MVRNRLITINKNISCIPALGSPLSSDVVCIKTGCRTWIFDVGADDFSAAHINSIHGCKNIVISHFHHDHTANLAYVKFDALFVSPATKKYTGSGIEITSVRTFEENPSVTLLPMPSSHAKGCLALLCGDYAFLGDSLYCTVKNGAHVYNVQLLREMIQTLENIPCPYFCLSHEPKFIQKKETVVELYKAIYARKTDGSPYINVDSYFNEDGSVKR
ncbi:MAG: MBL fold metallo-hydrolase [Bacteroides sp.]|nr:MBL fold metallo-hydrolase [Prevotella sp.]MCM1407936.1 MBL fold metallo-hydrolase [Treponema brennaborense]MCM1469678.1 MBL fold metallo-hydrolase [Bacteroides sp.]